MSTKVIPLKELATDPRAVLSECCDSGEGIVVELPDRRLVSIQPIASEDDESFMSDLIDGNPEFRKLLEESAASPRQPFPLPD